MSVVARCSGRIRAALGRLSGGGTHAEGRAPRAHGPSLTEMRAQLHRRSAELERTERVSAALGGAGQRLIAARSLDELHHSLRTEAQRGDLRLALAVREPRGGTLRVALCALPGHVVRAAGRRHGIALPGHTVELGRPAALEHLLRAGRPAFMDGADAPIAPWVEAPEATEIAPSAGHGPPSPTAAMHVPLYASGTPIGLLTLMHPALRARDVTAANTFGHQIATALEKGRLSAETDERARRIKMLSDSAHQLAMTADLHAMADLVTDMVRRELGSDAAALYVVRGPGEHFELASVDGLSGRERGEAERTALDRHPGWVVRNRRPLFCEDANRDPRVISAGRGVQSRSLIYVPLIIEGARCVGALGVASRAPYAYRDSDLRLMSALADQVAIAVANALLVDQAERRADRLHQAAVAGRHITAGLDLGDLLQRSISEAANVFGVSHASIYHVTDGRFEPAAAHHPPSGSIVTLGPADLGRLRRLEGPLAISDLRATDALPGLQMRLIERGVHSALIVPIVHKERSIGCILLYALHGRRAFSRESRELARLIAGQIAVAIDNARLYEATVESTQRADAIIQSSFAGVITVDGRGEVQRVNPAAAELLGRGVEQLVGRPLDAALGIPLWSEPDGPMAEVRRTGREHRAVERVLPRRAARRERDVLVGIAPLPSGFVISMADVTRLKEIDRLKTELVANVSHELRSPLTSIKAYTELLLEDVDSGDTDTRRAFLQIIDDQSDQLSQCINNLLDLARVEAEGYQLRTERFRLGDWVHSAVATVSLRTAGRDQTIDVSLPEHAVWLEADRPLLLSMLQNLLDNAAKFSPSGARVVVAASLGREELRIDVRDSGPGIPREQQARVFEKFYRVRSSTESGIEGSGLGLVIARQAARAHGGEITLDSQPGHGSTFSVHLPRSVVRRARLAAGAKVSAA